MITRRNLLSGRGSSVPYRQRYPPQPNKLERCPGSECCGTLVIAEEEKIPLGGLVEGLKNFGYVDGETIFLSTASE